MKLKIISFVVVFVFVMSMLPANVFAHTPAHDDCQDGPLRNGGRDSVEHKTTMDFRSDDYESDEEDCLYEDLLQTLLESEIDKEIKEILVLMLVGLIVWKVWPKDTGYANTNLEEVEDNLSATESTNNWGWTASYDYEEDSYSLGASYGF